MPARRPVRWRLRLRSPPDVVHRMLATDAGRARFWAERTETEGRRVRFLFSDGAVWAGTVLEDAPPARFVVEYLGGGPARFTLEAAPDGGTDLLLEQDVDDAEWEDNLPGWVSVLLALKAAVDHGVDLRSHDATRTWRERYVDP